MTVIDLNNRVYEGPDGLAWRSEPDETAVTLEEIDHFDGRGMRCVYGRGDHFGRHESYHMDIFVTRRGRLFMRWWSRSEDAEWLSFEIKGVDVDRMERQLALGFKDRWIPQDVRDAYAAWVHDQFYCEP
jgi:hypothetical protein